MAELGLRRIIDGNGQPRYLIFRRSDLDVWQWIAGGGEEDEKPEQTAREEAGIPEDSPLIQLDSECHRCPATKFEVKTCLTLAFLEDAT